MANIKLILSSIDKNKNPSFYEGLVNLKNSGRDFACINYPNAKRLKTEAYRVNMWSPKAKRLYQFDILARDGMGLDELISISDIPRKCTKTNCDLLNFSEIIENGIMCPHCGKELNKEMWFSNEK